MSEKFEWEKLASQRDTEYWFMTHRAKIPAGWLYRTFDLTNYDGVKSTSESMVFVPDAQSHQESGNAPIAPNSQPNVSQDGELQSFQRYMDELEKNNARIDKLSNQFTEDKAWLLDKIGELSMKLNTMQSSLREFEKQRHIPLIERVNLLEGKMLEKYCDAFERIEKLEIMMVNSVDHEKSNAARIEKLETKLKEAPIIISHKDHRDHYFDLSSMCERLDHHYGMHKDHYNNHEQVKKGLQLVVQDQDKQCVQLDKLESLTQDVKIYAHPMQAQVWQENMIKRIASLENIFSHLDILKTALNNAPIPRAPQWLPGESPMPQQPEKSK